MINAWLPDGTPAPRGQACWSHLAHVVGARHKAKFRKTKPARPRGPAASRELPAGHCLYTLVCPAALSTHVGAPLRILVSDPVTLPAALTARRLVLPLLICPLSSPGVAPLSCVRSTLYMSLTDARTLLSRPQVSCYNRALISSPSCWIPYALLSPLRASTVPSLPPSLLFFVVETLLEHLSAHSSRPPLL